MSFESSHTLQEKLASPGAALYHASLRMTKGLALVGTLMLFLTACVTTNEANSPVAQLQAGEQAIENAKQAGAEQYAPVELAKAQEHMEKARDADRDEDYRQAVRFSEKARVDAELAQAKTEHEQAATALAEVEEGIRTLETELAPGENNQPTQQELN